MKTDFMDILTPDTLDAELKFAPFFQGINPNQLASFEQATTFVQQHLRPLITAKGVSLSDPAILANSGTGAAGVAPYLLASNMIAEGLPSTRRLNLIYVFGVPDPDSDKQVQGINVALAIRMFFGTPTTAPNPEGLWAEISRHVPPMPSNTPAPPPEGLLVPVKLDPKFDPFAPPPIFGHDPVTGAPLKGPGIPVGSAITHDLRTGQARVAPSVAGMVVPAASVPNPGVDDKGRPLADENTLRQVVGRDPITGQIVPGLVDPIPAHDQVIERASLTDDARAAAEKPAKAEPVKPPVAPPKK